MQENFNQSKSKRLGSINSQGKTKKERLLKLQNDLEQAKEHLKDERAILLSLESDIEQINTQISNFNAEIKVEDNNEYQEILTQVRAIETKLQQPSQTLDVIASLKTDKRSKEYQLEDINKQLARKQINENMKNRIAELMEEERALAKQIAELEGHEYMCEEFIRAKVELLESSINSKFKYVSFKLFDTQVNGGLVETCEALIDGVPFSNANTASQINAGLDIINALSEYYNVSAPIFIDNRESVNEIIECNSQIINLVVSKDKTLQIISLESEVA